MAVIFDIGYVSGVAIVFVSDGLSATIGQQDVVRAGGNFAIAGLLVAKVVVRIIIFDLVGKFVRVGRL